MGDPAAPAAVPGRRPYSAPHVAQWTEAGLQEAGRLWLKVQGASMLPFLQEGDRLELRPLGPCPPRRGDLLVFVQGEHLLVHRLLRWDDASCRTAGDALTRPDPPVARAALLGRAGALACRWGEADLDRRPWPAFQALLAVLLNRRLAGGPGAALAGRSMRLLTRYLPPVMARSGSTAAPGRPG